MKKAYLLSFGIIAAILTSCNDKDPQPAPTITEIEPTSGKFNTSIVISGTDFVGSSLAVKINDKPLVITASTATQLTATIPKGAGTGKITVSANGGSVDGPVFTYIPTVTVTTFAGGGTSGFGDGTGIAAKFRNPSGLTFDNSGNLYVCDRNNNRIRKITPEGVTTTVFGPSIPLGNSIFGVFLDPSGIAFDGVNNFYVAVAGLSSIMTLNSSGVTPLAGDIQGFGDGTGLQAKFDFPTSLVVDKQGNIIVADFVNKRVRKVTPGGVVTTIAGDGSSDFVAGNGIAAHIGSVWGLTQDSQSNFYFTTFQMGRILKMTAQGDITSFAGDGTEGFADGPSETAKFSSTYGMVIDKSGALIVSDGPAHRIRRISEGVVSTIAGDGTAGLVNGDGSIARFNLPYGLAINSAGEIFVCDRANHAIRKIVLE